MSNTADATANACTNPFTLDNDKLMTSMRLACDWLTDIAQTPTDELPANTVNQKGFAYSSWKGAFRGEYSAANRQWWYYCPIWHGSQAVKALVMASEILGDQKYLDAAKLGAQWIFNNQVWDKSSPDHGLILAFEDIADKVNTSAVLECMHGLMMLADQTNSQEMWDRIIAAGDFIVRKMFMPEAGLFRDVYDPAKHDLLLPNPFRTKNDIGGRPLIDDAILLKLYDKTGDTRFRDVHISICETLLRDQNPAGNWLDYGPCSAEKGLFHPRHTYWWGMPMLDTYRETNREEFLKVAIASGEFCQHAMRADGGWIRGLYTGFNTECFGHATSGSACAAILWMELYKQTRNAEWIPLAQKAITYCQSVQMVDPRDEYLKGTILERVLAPDGTDRNPYYIRDLGSIFFVQACANFLQLSKSAR